MNATYPQQPQTIGALLEATVEQHGNSLALIEGTTELTYAELFERSRRFGAALVACGVESGDRVALWAPNGVEWIVAYLGLIQAGATLVPVNTRFKGAEAGEILRRTRARVLVTVTDFLGVDYAEMVAQGAGPLPALEVVIVTSDDARPGLVGWGEALSRVTEASLAELDRRRIGLRSKDPADILFTSGTTGTPKGAVATHAATLAVASDWVVMAGLRPGDRYLMINPYFHMFGLKSGILASIAAGVTMVPLAVFDVDRALEMVSKLGITILPGPPTLYQSILDHPDRASYDLSSLRVAVTGPADIPVVLIERVQTELPFAFVAAGYGLTEAGTATGTSPSDSPVTIATTVGRARPGFELRIVDASGGEVEVDSVGEVILRGPSTMAGYLDDPAATAQVLTADGWLSTGDLGRVDSDGYLRITGRIKDMFTVGGFNVYPAEVESILLRHPGVRLVAVVGIPETRLGEVGAAFIVPRHPAPTGDEIIEWSRANMANYKVPRRVEIVDELPVNAAGKVEKVELRNRLLPLSAGDT